MGFTISREWSTVQFGLTSDVKDLKVIQQLHPNNIEKFKL